MAFWRLHVLIFVTLRFGKSRRQKKCSFTITQKWLSARAIRETKQFFHDLPKLYWKKKRQRYLCMYKWREKAAINEKQKRGGREGWLLVYARKIDRDGWRWQGDWEKKIDKHAEREWTKCRVESEFSCSSGYPICCELFMHYISKGILATVTVAPGLTRLDFLASQRKSGHRRWCNPQQEDQVAESTVPTHQKTAS